MGRKSQPQQSNELNTPLFRPRTRRQAEALELFKENDLTMLLGPAGTGKTHVAVFCALADFFNPSPCRFFDEYEEQDDKYPIVRRRKVEKIYITRPIVEAGEKLGALPGELSEKVHPYMIPVYDCVSKLVDHSEDFLKKYVEIAPLAFMRGRTFENCVVVLDEAQNCTELQLKMFLSRLGIGGKMIITGDPDQSDIGNRSALRDYANYIDGIEGVGTLRFQTSDIVRHPLVGKILARLP